MCKTEKQENPKETKRKTAGFVQFFLGKRDY